MVLCRLLVVSSSGIGSVLLFLAWIVQSMVRYCPIYWVVWCCLGCHRRLGRICLSLRST